MISFTDAYIAETSHPDIRATLASLLGFADQVGISSIWILGHFASYRTVAWMAVAMFVPLIAMFCYLPETPYWLVEHGQIDQAKKSLHFFRGDDDITVEFQEIYIFSEEKISKSAKSWYQSLKDLTSLSFIKPFLCVGITTALFAIGGFTVLANYLSEFIVASGSTMNPTLGQMIIGFIRLGLAIIVPWFPSKINPKVLFTIGQSLVAFTNICIAIYYHVHYIYPNSELVTQVNWIPLVMFVLQISIRTSTVFPLLYSLPGELFPTQIRTLAVGITQSLEYCSAGIIVKLYPDMKYFMGFYGVCYFYASIGILNTFWGYVTIPDNRSKSLVEIEKAYSK